jgi:hypothetical protein
MSSGPEWPTFGRVLARTDFVARLGRWNHIVRRRAPRRMHAIDPVASANIQNHWY